MNGLTGSSIYDSLNKLAIGYLLLLPIIQHNGWLDSTSPYPLAILALYCWLAGLFFWAFLDIVIFPNSKFIPWYKTLNLDWINNAYTHVSNIVGKVYNNTLNVPLKNLGLYDYYAIYFEVQKEGLLGTVPLLESFSAFFRNIPLVFLGWTIAILSHYWNPLNLNSYTPAEMTLSIILIIVLGIVSLIFRYYVEKKIFQSIFESYFLGCK